MAREPGLTLLAATLAVVVASTSHAQTTPPQPAPAAPPAASQAPSQPPFATTKIDGTDNVYVFRYQGHQSMFVVTPDGVIATDPISYGRPQAATTYIDEIRKITNAPIKFLVYSHHHYDHAAGGKPFKAAGATIIGHRRAKERLDVLKAADVPAPDEVVDDKRTIELGGTTVELILPDATTPTLRWSSSCPRRRSSSPSTSIRSARCRRGLR